MLSLRFTIQIKYWAVLLAGMLFALIVWGIMTLQFRYVMAISAGIVMISVAMIMIRDIETFIIYALIFNIPFARLGKYFFAEGQPWSIALGITIGLAEVLLVMAYMVWFSQIFIARKKPIPKLHKIDYFIILLLLTQMISFVGAPNKTLGIFDIVYNIKHILIYIFITHKVKRQHLKWIIAIFLFAIFLESSIAGYEQLTGNVGIGKQKGRMTDSNIGTQYKVPGSEHLMRAAGTAKDSHALGLYYAMVLPIPLIFTTIRVLKPPIRCVLAGILIIGIIGLVVTFSRSGWLSFTLAAILAICITVFLWRLYGAIFISIAILFIVTFLYPQSYQYIYERLFDAPPELIEQRWDLNHTAFNIWRSHFLFGYGPGNYVIALEDPDITWYGSDDLPVHNAFLYVIAELGLLGVIAFFGIILLAIVQCIKMLKCGNLFFQGFSLAIMLGLIAYLLDGITDPMFREAVPYAQLWVYIGLAVALKRLLAEEQIPYNISMGT